MGGIFSRWRKKLATEDILQELQTKIETLEESQKINIEKQKRLIGSLILYSVLLYVGAALLFYFYYMPESVIDRLKYSSPLAAFPILVWLTKRFLHWYFVKRITKNEAALQDLKEKRKTILEDVMEKETYKKAKEILEKYDPDKLKTVEGPSTSTPVFKSPDGQELRQRNVPHGIEASTTPAVASTPAQMVRNPGPSQLPMATPTGPPRTAIRPRMMAPGSIAPGGQINSTRMAVGSLPPGPPLPRPVLPRERSVMDKLVEYLVGDGPQNRYALICQQCHSHNGMAMREEYEYIHFRCCYCYTLNPAKKQRPHAPKLEPPLPKPDSTQENEQEVDSEVSSRNDDVKSDDVDDQRDSSSSDKTEQKKRN